MQSLREHPVLGIALGGTRLSVVLGTVDGEILAEEQRPTPADRGPRAVISTAAEMARALARGREVAIVGVAHGGPVDAAGELVDSPNMPGWREVPLARLLREELGLPVIVENDANAGALAEFYFGAGRGLANIAYLTMGTGIGGGLILGGKLYRGTRGLAGEVGHTTVVPEGAPCTCGKRGCLQAYASGPGIAARAREAAADDADLLRRAGGDAAQITCELVCQAARAGNPTARRVIEQAARYMGQAIADLTLALDLELVALGTLAIVAGDLFLPAIRATVREQTETIQRKTCRVEPSALGERSGALAPIAVARAAGEREAEAGPL